MASIAPSPTAKIFPKPHHHHPKCHLYNEQRRFSQTKISIVDFVATYHHRRRHASCIVNAAAESGGDGRILLSDVVVKRPTEVYRGRKWNVTDMATAAVVAAMHLLCCCAPFTFSWKALSVAVALYVVTGLFGITLSFHRNLSHKSFQLPKWLEYAFAYCGVQALQCGEANNVGDLEKQPFYRFLQSSYIIHPIAFALLLYALGGFPFIVWGMGVRTVWVYHITWLVNSACHVWGHQAWNTRDLSRNNCWVGILSFGEGWHNNHHAFEYSARHGLEWWQVDMTWYMIRLLEIMGIASDVKLPTPIHIQRMAFPSKT